MGCSGCKKRNRIRHSGNIMDQYKYLNDRQIKARLEIYKKQHCSDCKKKERCDYEKYVNCKKRKK